MQPCVVPAAGESEGGVAGLDRLVGGDVQASGLTGVQDDGGVLLQFDLGAPEVGEGVEQPVTPSLSPVGGGDEGGEEVGARAHPVDLVHGALVETALTGGVVGADHVQ